MDIYATCIIARGYPETYYAALLKLERNSEGQLIWRAKEYSLHETAFEEEFQNLLMRWSHKPTVHLGKIHEKNLRKDNKRGLYFFYRGGDI